MDNELCKMDENEVVDLADLFKMFSDSTRVKIMYTLMSGEKSVNEIADEIDMNQSAVSHQLKLLKTSELITSRRDGKSKIYSLADDHVRTILETGKEHIEE